MRASEADLIRLSERRPERNQAFDLRVVRGTTINDLNTLLLEKYYLAAKEENELPGEFPALQSWLTLRQLGKETNGTWTPNAAGLLLFGQSPQDHFPGARVEFVKYAGIDVDSPIAERATVTGTLTDQIESLWTRINANVVDVPKIDQGAVTLYRKTYPINGMRELIRNMIQHRLYEGTNAPGRVEWYDNRVEISNPGGPFGRASEGEFGSHSDYRNPVITQWLAELGYVEQLGRGVRLLRISLQKNGNPDLAVELDGFTRVIVRRTP
jgi:ATP-dependent DNA helicase RecG